MEEHKLLTGMLLAALVVSVAGAFMTLDSLSQVSGVTGAATGTGTATTTISADATISTSADNAIAFGAGSVWSGSAYAVLYSNNESAVNGDSNISVNGTWAIKDPDNITLENQGNTDLNITVQSNVISGTTASSFVCGDNGVCINLGGGAAYQSNGTDFAFRVATSEVDAIQGQSCNRFGNSSSVINGVYDDILPAHGNLTNQSWTSFQTVAEEYIACECFQHESDNDELAFYLKAGIPADAPVQTDTTATLTFTSTQAEAASCP